jgi:hypothetical protein
MVKTIFLCSIFQSFQEFRRRILGGDLAEHLFFYPYFFGSSEIRACIDKLKQGGCRQLEPGIKRGLTDYDNYPVWLE